MNFLPKATGYKGKDEISKAAFMFHQFVTKFKFSNFSKASKFTCKLALLLPAKLQTGSVSIDIAAD